MNNRNRRGGSATPTELSSDMDIDTYLDGLYEKRYDTREAFLIKLLAFLREDCYNLDNTATKIAEALHKCLRSNRDSEIKHACRALSAFVLTLGPSDLFEGILDTLLLLVSNNENSDVVAEALSSAAVLQYIVEESADELLIFLDTLIIHVDSEEPTVACAAANAYALITSKLPDTSVVGTILPEYVTIVFQVCSLTVPSSLQILVHRLLRAKDVSLRIALGNLIALIIGMERDHNLEEDDEPSLDSLEELMDTVNEYADEKSRDVSKQLLSQQRRAFATIRDSLLESVVPVESIELNNQMVEVHDWPCVIPLNVLRSVLTVGFHLHLIKNEMLQDILEVEIDESYVHKNLSQVEKRVFRGANERNRKVNRGKERNDKRGANAFPLGDE